jgi:hypothetical protein
MRSTLALQEPAVSNHEARQREHVAAAPSAGTSPTIARPAAAVMAARRTAAH